MKKIRFSRLYAPAVLLSLALIVFGVVGFVYRGVNFGIDFQAGFIEKVKIAPTAFELSYRGPKTVSFSQSRTNIDIVITGVDGQNKTEHFSYTDYPSVQDFISAVASIEGVSVSNVANDVANVPLNTLFFGSQARLRLSDKGLALHYYPKTAALITVEEVRRVLAAIEGVSVQQLGKNDEQYFQIRLPDDGTKENANAALRSELQSALERGYGSDKIVIMSTDFVASRFSGSLAWQAITLISGALLLIFFYTWFRFRLQFALAAIFAIIHDGLMMFVFITWSQMEFSSIIVAAVLTIIGYSINDTIVIFDRVRENASLKPDENISDIVDFSLTEMLGRTIITTFTTMLAALPLFLFTEGGMKNFALILMIGMLSGVYSSIFISNGYVAFIMGKTKCDKLFAQKKTPSVYGAVV